MCNYRLWQMVWWKELISMKEKITGETKVKWMKLYYLGVPSEEVS